MNRLGAALAVSISLLLLAAPGAPAAVEVGNPCVANDSQPDWTAAGLTREGSPLPLAMPAAGVITSWKLSLGTVAGLHEQRLRIYRETKVTPYELTTVIESATPSVLAGVNTFPVRLPVKVGDLLGLYGPVETYFCDKENINTAAKFAGPAPVGTTNTFSLEKGVGMPVTATLEPDVDGDGFGDETQDGCPRSGVFQSTCPTVTLTRKAVVRKRAILIQIRASSEATVQVFGQVSWQVRRKGGGNRGLTAGLSAGRPQSVATGTTVIFRLPLTKPVKRRLGRLEPSQSLRATLTARVTDLAGLVTDHRFKVRLRGRG